MVNVVTRRETVESGNPRCSVVGDDLFESSPSAENVLEEEVRDDIAAFGGGSSCFRPGCQSATTMEDVSVGSALRHVERVEVSFAKNRRNVRNGRRNVKVLGLPNLALVACSDIPANVVA